MKVAAGGGCWAAWAAVPGTGSPAGTDPGDLERLHHAVPPSRLRRGQQGQSSPWQEGTAPSRVRVVTVAPPQPRGAWGRVEGAAAPTHAGPAMSQPAQKSH